MDPLCEKYYGVSPYSYCAGNSVSRIDPGGRDWYETIDSETKEKQFLWTDYKSQDEMDSNNITGSYLGEAFVHFEGSMNERLNTDGKITEENGGNPAQVTIYGVNGPDDINTYSGLSVTSDPDQFSMIASGDYKAYYRDMSGSYGSKGNLQSYYILTLDRSGIIPTEGG